ncbi:hypothetical protein A0H81_12909 [Grifola frondosa]|uniref:ATP-dependent DNA helicase n=1 Tax=Grifola frondosa TaxID=5627 RepID=A0A1C7LSI9_GRIFR|nr:hypothetical protein A0H81_12909 [Grifola frondosa]
MRRVIPSRRARSSLLRSFISSQLSPIPIPCHCCYATSTLPFLNPRLLEVQPPINNSVAGPSHNPPSLAREHKAEHALAEAAHRLKSPHQLRLFFVYLLVNDYVKSPYTTWQTYQDIFSQDFILECDNINVGVNKALHTISRLLEEHGKSLGMYGLPDPNFHSPEVEEELKTWSSNPELLAARAGKAVAKLNAEQYKIYTQIMDAVLHNRPLCAFVDGKAGRGKTFLVTTICNKLRSMNRIVLPTATSGFAAQLYPGGRTTHSTFRVPITNEVKKDKKDNGSEGFLDVFSEDGIKFVEVLPEEVVDGSGNAEEFQMVSEDTLEELISPIEASDPRGS